MVAGVESECVICGQPVVSCVLPAYCFRCGPLVREHEERMNEALEALIQGCNDSVDPKTGERKEDCNEESV
jgi:hypothetical protein